jgi:hypothetical protein
MVISLAQDELGWPEPAVYADAGQPGGQLADLVEAITAGRHDGVFATHPVPARRRPGADRRVRPALPQIALATGEFRTGRYVRDDKWDSRSWRRGET